MHILVTGSSGTIGTHLAETLLTRGITCTGIDRRPNRWLPDVDHCTVRADLLAARWGKHLSDTPDLIVHLAANARVYKLTQNPDLARENVISTLNVLEEARRRGVKRIILASSREVYGSHQGHTCEEEKVNLEDCENPYTASKIALEAFARSYAQCYGISVVIVRYSNVYGMYDDSDRVIPLFLRSAQEGKPLAVYGAEKTLDFTHVSDAVAGTLLALEKFDVVAGQTFNIATGQGVKIADVAKRLASAYGGKSTVTLEANRTGEVMHCCCSIEKAKRLLGYAPQVDISTGIERTVAWYDSHA